MGGNNLTSVVFHDLRSGESHALPNLALGEQRIPWLSFTVSPTGDTLLFTRVAESESDILMVEGFR